MAAILVNQRATRQRIFRDVAVGYSGARVPPPDPGNKGYPVHAAVRMPSAGHRKTDPKRPTPDRCVPPKGNPLMAGFQHGQVADREPVVLDLLVHHHADAVDHGALLIRITGSGRALA